MNIRTTIETIRYTVTASAPEPTFEMRVFVQFLYGPDEFFEIPWWELETNAGYSATQK